MCVFGPCRLLQHFAELGCTYKPTKPSLDAQESEGAPPQSYTVTLLRNPAKPDCTLAEVLPKIKMGARKGR